MRIPYCGTRIRCLVLLSDVLVILLGNPSVVRADGIRNPFQGAAVIAQGNTFSAQADDPTAVFYNPAGMTQLHGVQHTAGVQFVSVNTYFTSPTGVSTRNEQHGRFLGLLTCRSEAGFFGRKALGIDVAYQALLFESRTVTGNPNPTVNGTYQTTTHAGSITMRGNF
ncbi:MAG: hypothetical protein P0120_14655 [Nitrospira sp.]|nr:hypothetical protein [Nitrospira sp.]